MTNLKYTEMLREAYADVAELYAGRPSPLPKNEGRELKLRKLDCLVISHFMDTVTPESVDDLYQYQTVRCPFEEGEEAFTGSMLRKETHIRIAVRDLDCLLGIFRPNI